jgi:acetylornithine/LysW-gamma-L-lysine aminotransferase
MARLLTGRTGVVAAVRGFHGRTMGALSATWEPKYREPFAPLLPGFVHIPYDKLDALDAAVDETTATVLLELVQGEGGVRPGSTEFLRAIRDGCSEHGALMIVDEVQTGLGRTGRMFAFEHHGVVPDVLTLAKSVAGGLPMGVIAFGDRVRQIVKLAHTTTFGGNPLVCAVARSVLQHLVEQRIPERVAEQGAYFFEALRRLDRRRIRDIRGCGLMIGIELKEKAGPYAQQLMEEGVLVLLAGTTVLRLLPPLIIERDEVDRVVTALGKVLG